MATRTLYTPERDHEVWVRAGQLATERGSSLSRLVGGLLRTYVNEQDDIIERRARLKAALRSA